MKKEVFVWKRRVSFFLVSLVFIIPQTLTIVSSPCPDSTRSGPRGVTVKTPETPMCVLPVRPGLSEFLFLLSPDS